MRRGRSRRATLRGGQVVEVSVLEQLRRFHAKALGYPVARVIPAVVDPCWFPENRETVGGQLCGPAPIEVEVTSAVGPDHMAGGAMPSTFRSIGSDQGPSGDTAVVTQFVSLAGK